MRESKPANTKPKTATTFPDVMSGLAGDFAKLYSDHLEVPIHFFYVAFLTLLGSVLADRLTVASEISPQPRLYVILLGESADDRKSTALSKTTDFFREAIPDLFNVSYGIGSAEGLQKILEKNNKLVLVLDEFKQFISKCKIDASVLLPFVNTLFESNRYETRTKNSHIKLDDAYLSLLAASTIQTYENIWSSQFTDIGFNNRLFLVPGSGERKYSFPVKIPSSEKELLKQRLFELLLFTGNYMELDLTEEARDLYHHWYMNLEKSVHSKRLDTYALRFMALLAVNELKREVDDEIVRKAVALADWQLEVRSLHDPVDADNEIAVMEEKIRRVLKAKGPLKSYELRKAVNANRKGIWIFDTSIKNLQNRVLEIGYDKKTKRYFLLHESFA